MGLPGTYVKVTKIERNPSENYSVIVPYSEEFGFSCRQAWFMPLKELYEYLEQVGKDLSKGFLGSSFNLVKGGLRIFGVQMFTKGFSAKAWEKEEPIDLGLNLKFFLGMNGLWKASEEVYSPIMTLMAKTVPKEGALKEITLISPGPTGVDVFVDFASDFFKGIGLNKTTSQVATELGATIDSRQGIARTRDEDTSNTWTIEIGYSKDGNKIELPFFVLSELVVTNAGFTFSPELDETLCPINGVLKLNFTAQNLIIASNFTDLNLYQTPHDYKEEESKRFK
jgi:hypothetical protein